MSRKKQVVFHIISIIVLIGLSLIGLLVQRSGYTRLIESLRDFGLSVAYWFTTIFGVDANINVTVNELSIIHNHSTVDFNGVLLSIKEYFVAFGSTENLLKFAYGFVNVLFYILMVLPFLMLLIIPIVIIIYCVRRLTNNNWGKKSKPLLAYEFLSDKVFSKVKNFIADYMAFIRTTLRGVYWILAVVNFLITTSIIPIFIELLAYVFYSSLGGYNSLFIQLYKFCLDLLIVIEWQNVIVYAIFALYRFNVWRMRFAKRRLVSSEARFAAFVKKLPIATLIVGKPGTGKTTMGVNIALTESYRMRNNAFEGLIKNDMRFPNFPWILFEKGIQKNMAEGHIYNLYTCRKYVGNIYRKWENGQTSDSLFGYDYKKYGLTYDDGLIVKSLFDVLESYAQQYFIYIINTSVIQSNLSIREDTLLRDGGNLPLWDNDFFRMDSSRSMLLSRYSHILDWDAVRLGKKIINSNTSNYIEFGVFMLTEFAKDRGNQNDYALLDSRKSDSELLKELKGFISTFNRKINYVGKQDILAELKKLASKKVSPEEEAATQLNDYFNLMVKMIRHMCTVDNVCYSRIIADEQRIMSLNADCRELMDVIRLEDQSDQRSVYPFFVYDDIFFGWIWRRFKDKYVDYRYRRGDTTLTQYLKKAIVSKICARYERLINRFNVYEVSFSIQDGTMDGDPLKGQVTLSTLKTYRDRFASNCYFDFFEHRVASSNVGLLDVPEYHCTYPTLDELKLQNSYFVRNLCKFFYNEEE